LKPNYEQLGFSYCMGPELRQEVERQLLEDLKHYIEHNNKLKFDWSESCIEGSRINYLDGEVEDFSGIRLFDSQDQIFADGWMNFHYDRDQNLFVAYWDILEIHKDRECIELKTDFEIPEHVNNYIERRLRND